jgi:hypothetical protein
MGRSAPFPQKGSGSHRYSLGVDQARPETTPSVLALPSAGTTPNLASSARQKNDLPPNIPSLDKQVFSDTPVTAEAILASIYQCGDVADLWPELPEDQSPLAAAWPQAFADLEHSRALNGEQRGGS